MNPNQWQFLEDFDRAEATFAHQAIQNSSRWLHIIQIIWGLVVFYMLKGNYATTLRALALALSGGLVVTGAIGIASSNSFNKFIAGLLLLSFTGVIFSIAISLNFVSDLRTWVFGLLVLAFGVAVIVGAFQIKKASSKLGPGDHVQAKQFSEWLLKADPEGNESIIKYQAMVGPASAAVWAFLGTNFVVVMGENKIGAAVPYDRFRIVFESPAPTPDQILGTLAIGKRTLKVRMDRQYWVRYQQRAI